MEPVLKYDSLGRPVTAKKLAGLKRDAGPGRPKKGSKAGHRYERKPDWIIAEKRPDIRPVGRLEGTEERWEEAARLVMEWLGNPPFGQEMTRETAYVLEYYKNNNRRLPVMVKKRKAAVKEKSGGGLNREEWLKLLGRDK
jgi:hypothetical protein